MPYYYCAKCEKDWESTNEYIICPMCREAELEVLEDKTPMEMAVEELQKMRYSMEKMVEAFLRRW